MQTNDEITSDRAWETYCKSGSVPPGYAAEIAARCQLCREWAAAGEPLR